MKILGVITARGGSKGVKGKNIKLLCGKPLLEYSAIAAAKASLLTKTILSTEDGEIAETGKKIGLDVPFMRPEELAEDNSATLPVLQHCLKELKKKGEHYDAVCLLQPPCPFRPDGFIDAAIEKFIETQPDSLVSVLPVPHEYNPHWVFEENSDGYLDIATGEKEVITQRQQLPKAFHRDGSIYITKSDVLLRKNSLLGQKIAFIESDPTYYVNIDTPEDWDKAETLAKKLGLCAE